MSDMSRFDSRLHYRGVLTFQTAHRIGSERALDPTVPDLPLLRAADNRPFIPGSSFKGAWRAYTESILRAFSPALACNPLSDSERCLPNQRINEIRDQYRTDAKARDAALRDASCLACRVFGNSMLAAKASIRDLFSQDEIVTEQRDGVAIDRDLAKVAHGPFQYEVVAPNVTFDVQIVVENGTAAELGAVFFGLEAFARGDVRLGGFKSRGLGVCTLRHKWGESRYIDSNNLLAYLFNADAGKAGQLSAAQIQEMAQTEWRVALVKAVEEAQHAQATSE